MNNKEIIKLSDLRRPGVTVPKVDLSQYTNLYNGLDDVVNNTSIEDKVLSNKDALQNRTISQKIQLLNDRQNQYNLINNEYKNVEQSILDKNAGRGITRLGRTSQILTRQNELNGQRLKLAADMEYLRGNISTSQQLRNEARKLGVNSDTNELEIEDGIGGIKSIDELNTEKLKSYISKIDPRLAESMNGMSYEEVLEFSKKLGIDVNDLTGGIIQDGVSVNSDSLKQDGYEEFLRDYVYSDKGKKKEDTEEQEVKTQTDFSTDRYFQG